jgi:CheY-like chemotaxis protein
MRASLRVCLLGSVCIDAQICQRIASAMGGALTATSAGRDMGTTFTFTIPLLEDTSEAGVAAGAAARYLSADDIGADANVTAASAGADANGGSAASLHAPLEEQQAPPAHAQQPAPSVMITTTGGGAAAAGGGQQRPLRVMVAEDDRLCASLMHKILARLQVDGTVVGDGAAAVAMYQQHGASCACSLSTYAHRAGIGLVSVLMRPASPAQQRRGAAADDTPFDIILMDLQCVTQHACEAACHHPAPHHLTLAHLLAPPPRYFCLPLLPPSSMPVLDGLGASRQIAELARAAGRRPTPIVVRSSNSDGIAFHPPSCAGITTFVTKSHRLSKTSRSPPSTVPQALTASCSEEQKQRCAEAGMVAHLSKPVKLETLQALLHKYASTATAARERLPPYVTRVSAWG